MDDNVATVVFALVIDTAPTAVAFFALAICSVVYTLMDIYDIGIKNIAVV